MTHLADCLRARILISICWIVSHSCLIPIPSEYLQSFNCPFLDSSELRDVRWESLTPETCIHIVAQRSRERGNADFKMINSWVEIIGQNPVDKTEGVKQTDTGAYRMVMPTQMKIEFRTNLHCPEPYYDPSQKS